MFLIILAILQSSPAPLSEAESLAAQSSMEYYAKIERYAVASEDITTCSVLGYRDEGRERFMQDLVEAVWRPRNEVEPIEYPDFIDRFNATLRRVKAENDSEAEHAATSKEAFDIFQRNLSRRCESLASDHPLWLERKRTTSVQWFLAWNAIEKQMLGDAADTPFE